MSEILDCGHEPTANASPGTGYAEDPETGQKFCYLCADARQQEAIQTADVFVGYVSSDGRRFTTWTGGELGQITDFSTGKRQYTPSGGSWRSQSIKVRTPDGVMWHGRGSDTMDVIKIRRSKKKN